MKCHTVTNYSYPGGNPWDVVSGFKHDNRLKCHRGIVSQWTFHVGLNVTVDETWVDITSRHRLAGIPAVRFVVLFLGAGLNQNCVQCPYFPL
jgi:hypothetical protein